MEGPQQVPPSVRIPVATLRLGELLAALSLAFDIGNNFPLEKALRNAVLAVALGRELGLSDDDLSDVYYVAQLRYLGCTAFSHELARFLGVDELASRSAYAPIASSDTMDAVKTTITKLGKGAGLVPRTRAVVKMAAAGKPLLERGWVADCEAAQRLASRLGMRNTVCTAVRDVYSTWNGKGLIGRWVSGDDIPIAARIAFLVHEVEIHHRIGGRAAATDMVRRRAGEDLDPALCGVFIKKAPDLLATIERESVWEAALDAEPQPWPWLPDSRLDDVAQAFGDFADLKSPYTLGHSKGVAELAGAAGEVRGLSQDNLLGLRRAAWLHDLGRVSVPNTIWDKPGPLMSSQWERVRLHPYYTERVLAQTEVLRPLALIAGLHHERLDGSGYQRGVPGAMLSTGARLLAVADAYHAMTEERPHRPAMTPAAAAHELTIEAQSGRLDREAVTAVLEVTGQGRLGRRMGWPKDLSHREVEVLRLAARGKPNREIALCLHISENTVHHHVKRIYDKIGVVTRAGAALFAMEHDLLRD